MWGLGFFLQGHFGHFWGPGRAFFQGLRRFPEFGGGFRNMGGDSFVFCHHPTQRGCLIFTALALKRLPTWPLVETKLARPIRSQDSRASINSILPHTYLYLQWIVINALLWSFPPWCARSISDSGLLTSGSEDFHGGPALNAAKTLLVLNEDTSVQRKQYIE